SASLSYPFYCITVPTTYTLSLFFFYSSPDPRPLHSFPTRRSSDLYPRFPPRTSDPRSASAHGGTQSRQSPAGTRPPPAGDCLLRSEEHTSELQSHLNLVCRLLLEKKKKKEKIDNQRDKKKQTQANS